MTYDNRPTEQMDLACYLAAADADKPEALHRYLARTSPEVASNLLHAIATRAVPTRLRYRVFWFAPATILSIIAFGVILVTSPIHSKQSMYCLIPGIMLSAFGPLCQDAGARWRYRKGRGALLLLAERGDERALPLLTSEMQVAPPASQRDWNDKVAAALTQMLDEMANEPTPPDRQDRIRKLAAQLMLPHAQRAKKNDLTETQAYLVIAILRRLHAAGGFDNRDLIARIAAPSPRGTSTHAPQRAWVRETARNLFTPAPTVASASALTRPARSITPDVAAANIQIQRRS